MILIGLGANLPTSEFGPPVAGCEAALVELDNRGLRVAARSRWYTSAPVPPSDQPWFVNGVARVETALTPDAVLAVLHAVERRFGRVRTVRNAARTLDLDLLAYGDVVLREGEVVVPHPRLHERAFVLLPLAEVAPGWRHPVLGLTAAAMAEALPPDQTIRPLR